MRHLRLSYIPILFLMVVGMIFRYVGISQNLSFWNDEIHTALFSRAIVWYGKPVSDIGAGTGLYQSALYYVTAFFFKILGVHELSGRLPSVIVGTLLIVSIYIITKKILGYKEALIAAFLMAFSQMQLAWSTQLRPYIWEELFALLIAYLGYHSLLHRKQMLDKKLLLSFAISILATLFHGTGLIMIALVAYILFIKCIVYKKYSFLLSLIPITVAGSLLFYFSLSAHNRNILDLLRINTDLLHYRVFLQANYLWLIVGSVLGSIYLLFKNRPAAFIFIPFPIIIFIIAIFKINSGYVRYSLPAFPFLYILFSYGVVALGLWVSKKIRIAYLIPLAIILAAFLYTPLKKDKILLKPRYYYTINGDMRENPIVDYNKAFYFIRERIKNDTDIFVMDVWNDRVPWFLPGTKYAYLNNHPEAHIDPQFGEPIIDTVGEFEMTKAAHTKGLILLENWEHQGGPELDSHIRKTLKKEAEVKNLPYNEGDPWSISIYSWGM